MILTIYIVGAVLTFIFVMTALLYAAKMEIDSDYDYVNLLRKFLGNIFLVAFVAVCGAAWPAFWSAAVIFVVTNKGD